MAVSCDTRQCTVCTLLPYCAVEYHIFSNIRNYTTLHNCTVLCIAAYHVLVYSCSLLYHPHGLNKTLRFVLCSCKVRVGRLGCDYTQPHSFIFPWCIWVRARANLRWQRRREFLWEEDPEVRPKPALAKHQTTILAPTHTVETRRTIWWTGHQ